MQDSRKNQPNGTDVHAPGAQPRCADTDSPGASPSNTAPVNCIEGEEIQFKCLRCAVDSLYLSYPGYLADYWENYLSELKLIAQSEDPRIRDTAQLKINGHIFEVKDKGRGLFRYVLQDNWFHISLAGKGSKQLPLAYVQISSEVITALGLESVIEDLSFMINTFNHKPKPPIISRVDLCGDFTCDFPMDSINSNQWITRAKEIHRHDINRQFSGFSIGRGGCISGRLYDKTLEIEKSGKIYLYPLWAEQGWIPGSQVWRMEFQFKREFLKPVRVHHVEDLELFMGALWLYATEEWLKLCIPNPNDKTPSRWPLHPLWIELQEIDWNDVDDVPALFRVPRDRSPEDEFLFINGLGAITSFMVKNGIEDIDDGFGEYIARCIEFHNSRDGQSFEKYLKRKLKEKRRRFNTQENKPRLDYKGRAERAEAYRKGKDGE